MSSLSRMILSSAAVLLFSIPAIAGADKGRMDSAHWTAAQETKVGTIDLKPGEYEFKSQESGNELRVLQNGKVIGKVACQWIMLPKKATESQVLTDNNQITQVQFAGRTEAVQIQ